MSDYYEQVSWATRDLPWVDAANQGSRLHPFPAELAVRNLGMDFPTVGVAPPRSAESVLGLLKADIGWMASAACADHPDVRFFGPSSEAVEVCTRCRVRADCLAFALREGMVDGVWGGKTQLERKHMERPVPDDSVIYFAGGDDPTVVKIGTTVRLRTRLMALGLTVVATEPGSYQREAELHRRFADLRVHGEWFRFEGALVEYVECLAMEEAA